MIVDLIGQAIATQCARARWSARAHLRLPALTQRHKHGTGLARRHYLAGDQLRIRAIEHVPDPEIRLEVPPDAEQRAYMDEPVATDLLARAIEW
jgi:hypothetical protein